MKRMNVLIAMSMIAAATNPDDLIVDPNEQQGLVVLQNKEGDCYVTLTNDEYFGICNLLGVKDEDITEDQADTNIGAATETLGQEVVE